MAQRRQRTGDDGSSGGEGPRGLEVAGAGRIRAGGRRRARGKRRLLRGGAVADLAAGSRSGAVVEEGRDGDGRWRTEVGGGGGYGGGGAAVGKHHGLAPWRRDAMGEELGGKMVAWPLVPWYSVKKKRGMGEKGLGSGFSIRWVGFLDRTVHCPPHCAHWHTRMRRLAGGKGRPCSRAPPGSESSQSGSRLTAEWVELNQHALSDLNLTGILTWI